MECRILYRILICFLSDRLRKIYTNENYFFLANRHITFVFLDKMSESASILVMLRVSVPIIVCLLPILSYCKVNVLLSKFQFFISNFGIPLLVPYTKDFERITQF